MALLFYVIRNSIVFDTQYSSDLNKGIVPGLHITGVGQMVEMFEIFWAVRSYYNKSMLLCMFDALGRSLFYHSAVVQNLHPKTL